ncbi:MAG: AAA family ATPase [Myxococcales bacterium]
MAVEVAHTWSVVFRFGEFELDFALYELRRAGERVHVDRKVFDLLRYLVEHRDRVVTKQELLREVWNDEAVVEAVLPTAVARLRRALGQRGARDGPVETAHGRGYRFVADVTTRAPARVRELDTDLHPALREAFAPREDVLRRLSGALDRARAGSAQLRVLTGEPGIGRSRTLGELLGRARNAGVGGVLARCHEADAGDGLWLWTQVLRQLLDTLPGDAARALSGGLRRTLSSLIPELVPPGGQPPPREPSRELMDAVARFVQECAARKPRLIALDDLHHADADSLALLDYLASQLQDARVLIVATLQDTGLPAGHPAVRLVEQLERRDHVKRIELGPLDDESVAAYVHALAGQRPPPAVLEALMQASGGVPLFLREAARPVIAAILADEPLEPSAVRPPQRAREVVSERVKRLGDEVGQVLQAAAVAGVEIELPLLGRVLPLPMETIQSALDRARRARLVLPVEGDGLRFESELVRVMIYEDLSSARRCQLHLMVGEALEKQRPLRPRATREIALHLHAALPHGDPEKAMDYGVRAARRAAEARDHHEEAMWYARAMEGMRYAGDADVQRSAELMVSLGRAHRESGHPTAARDALQQALEMTLHDPGADRWAEQARAELQQLEDADVAQ